MSKIAFLALLLITNLNAGDNFLCDISVSDGTEATKEKATLTIDVDGTYNGVESIEMNNTYLATDLEIGVGIKKSDDYYTMYVEVYSDKSDISVEFESDFNFKGNLPDADYFDFEMKNFKINGKVLNLEISCED